MLLLEIFPLPKTRIRLVKLDILIPWDSDLAASVDPLLDLVYLMNDEGYS